MRWSAWPRWTQRPRPKPWPAGRVIRNTRGCSDSDPARPLAASRVKADLEKQEIRSDGYDFAIRTLTGGRLIGFIELDAIQWAHGDAYLAIGIGERDLWGKGYGTDAMREILRFAFEELNLHRVTLTVFEYNPRAIRTYEKVGFREEGRLRQHLEPGWAPLGYDLHGDFKK